MSANRRRLGRALAGALVVSALIAPAAPARPAEDPPARSGSPSTAPARTGTDVPAPTVSRTLDDGFDWGSAAVGAGGAAAVLLLTAAGASAVAHRRHRVRVVR